MYNEILLAIDLEDESSWQKALPAAVELDISVTEPGLQGDRVSGATKQATLETGLVVQVPPFISDGDTVRVNTETGEYQSRA